MSEYTAVMVGGPLDGQTKTHKTKAIRYPERRASLTLGFAEDEPVYYEHTYELDEAKSPPVFAYKGCRYMGTMVQMEDAARKFLDARDASK